MKTKQRTTVDYAITSAVSRAKRQDATWYADGDEHSWAATVYAGNNAIHIYSDGRLDLTVDGEERVRSASDLISAGIKTDEQLWNADDSNRIHWVNNCWFDLYDAESGEHLDSVHHSLDDAVKEAKAILADYPNGDK